MFRPLAFLTCSVAALALLLACEDDGSNSDGAGGNAGNGSVLPESGAGGQAPGEGACLDRPNELPRPPGAGLPCELFPPGYSR